MQVSKLKNSSVILPIKMSTSMFSVSRFCWGVLPYRVPTFSQFSWTNRTIFFTSSVTFLILYCCTHKRSITKTFSRQRIPREAPYVGLDAVVAADVGVLLTEAPVELQLAEISQQLNPPALHAVLAEVHHAVKVVVVGRLGLAVSFSVHWQKQA